jgi:2-methylcitrate dehydratase PrpD
MDDAPLETASVAQQFCDWAAVLDVETIPETVRTVAEHAVLDFAGLCVAARGSDYVTALLASWDGTGDCTALGHADGLDAAGAAVVNGAAAHGEDYDDTFEGTPVHTGAAVIPAVLAAGERYGASGADALRGIAVGTELMCRMALVAPGAIHRAGFHPTAVIGALGAASGVGAVLRLSSAQMTDALGIAGSLSSGIIEYLAEGTWTKRLHPGWAAQCGLRAALMGRHGFLGPRTVLEGEHGFFRAFAGGASDPDFTEITRVLGDRWRMEKIAFKPFACGTMAQPFVDCAIVLARAGVHWAEVSEIVCKVGEGTVHRLWEPLREKWNPSTPYSAKFSVPYCIAVGLIDRAAGLGQFTEERVLDPRVRALAAKIRYRIDPANEYPRNYSGHMKVTMKDGTVHEAEQPHFRGGAREPLSRQEILAKFHANAAIDAWPEALAARLEAYCAGLFEMPDLAGLKAFRA